MAELGRREAEHLIKEILTEYAKRIISAKKEEYIADVQPLFSPDIDAFYKLVKSEDMDFYIFNKLNDEGIRHLLNDSCRLAKCFELDSYSKIKKDFTYEPESPKCRIASDSGGKYTAGGSYTFTLEGKAELGNKWYEPYRVVWHFYRENPGTGKYEETSSKMDEARALADFDTWDRVFLVSKKGRYKVTATIFNQAITTGIRPDIVEVCELYFEAEEENNIENLTLSSDVWKIYLNEKNEIANVEYGNDRTKAQLINSDGSISEIINIDTEEYKKLGGFAKKLLTAAGIKVTSKADLELQEKMLDSGLFYINKEEGWIEKEKYFERMTPKDFLTIQDYKDVTVKAVYEDAKGELTFTYTAGGKTENLFVITASNNQKERKWPTKSGSNNTTDPDDIMYTTPPYGEEQVPYIPGKFPKGNWNITAFEKNGEKEYGPYKIRTDAWRYVEVWELVENKQKRLEWQLKKDSDGNIVKAKDSGLLIHGGGWSESNLDNKKGSNKYIDTTLGCIRISNLDVFLIEKTLNAYLAVKKINLEVK